LARAEGDLRGPWAQFPGLLGGRGVAGVGVRRRSWGGGRKEPSSGETAVNAGQLVAVGALVDARGGAGVVARPRE
jgi:hypothetical protein